MRDFSFRRNLTRSTQKLGLDVEDFKCLAFGTCCGWDSRAPINCKLTHYHFPHGIANHGLPGVD
jgi:hypothetical protein